MGHLAAYKAYLDQGRRVFTDSRKVIPDGVFVALKGPSFDGNQYAFEALDKGAAFAVVDRIDVPDPRLILVPDTLQALQDMGRRNRQNTSATIIAITGSNGKTTTKEIAYSIFSRAFKTLATS
ncbi:MAG TPA: Mur ligase family protein, partial [Saprospiraceae bacterium]|nr:Mur ligase family protein [Saprospiraceae bacterium]